MNRAIPWKLITTILIGLGVLFVAACFFFPIFTVSTIEVSGNSRESSDSITQASGVVEGANILRIDEGQAAAQVAALPWISKVNVKKALPTTVKVEVEERQAVLFASRSDGAHLIDATGVPFVIDAPPPGTPEISGTNDDNPEIFGPAASIVEALDPANRAQLQRVDARSRYEFTLYFADGKEVYWGSAEQNHDKALATKTVLQREGNKWNVSAPGLVTLQP